MKRITLLSLSVIALLLGSACATAQAASASSSGQSAATTSATAGAAPAAGASTQVEVTLADNTIASSLTTFKVGVPYTFVIKNNGNHQHNFNVNPPVSITGSEDASLKDALLTVTQDQLPIGGGTTVQYTFPPSAAGAALEFSCLIRRHYEDGMRLTITVTK
jgi:uncharacterized cupredoxin-like copper-binding protein